MSDGQETPKPAQSGGMDFRTLVSIASLIAAGAAIFYASTIDTRDQVADLDASVKTLTEALDGKPSPDSVKKLIAENVDIPAPGPSANDVQSLIDKTLADTSKRFDDALSTAEKRIDGALSDVGKRIDTLPNEAKVNEIAQLRAAAVDQKMGKLISGSTVPKGAVVAFATACPVDLGWKEHEAARGRFLVATGEHTDASGTKRVFAPGIGADNGGYEHKLTVDEMPRHRHAIDRQGPTRGIADLPPIGTDGAVIAVIEQEKSHVTGGSGAHNNVPPYIALHFCEKT